MTAPTSSYADEMSVIADWLKGQWGHTGIDFPNMHYDPGEAAAYVRVRVSHQPAFNVEISSTQKTVRHPGMLSMQVRTRRNVGDGQGLEYADELAQLFANQTLSPRIYFRAATVNHLGHDGSGWDVTEVTCPFYRDSFQ